MDNTNLPRFNSDSPRFLSALTLAAELHAKQTRKSTDIPYISHLLGVASIAIDYGGGEDEAIGALLHDAAEDQGGMRTLNRIRAKFGDAVADIVDGCTDAYAEAGKEKPEWERRKASYIAHLYTASQSVKLVSLADKLHNARAILADYRSLGDGVFARFKKDKYATLWYYRRLANTFKEVLPGQLADELDRTVAVLEALSTLNDDEQTVGMKMSVFNKFDSAVDNVLATKAVQA